MPQHVIRTWQAPGGWDGPGWPWSTYEAFRKRMEALSAKRKGSPRLVVTWVRSRHVVCWYEAVAGREERALRNAMRRLFGQRERHPKEMGGRQYGHRRGQPA